jgi:AcrR family transcriptional regulator
MSSPPLASLPAARAAAPPTRDRILDEAEALFAEGGFSGTSVRDIAARTGLTAASLYNHFDGKRALYAAVLERGVRPLIALMEEAGTREQTPDASDALIGAVMEHLSRRPHLARLIVHEAVVGGADGARLARDWIRPLLASGLAEMAREPGSPWEPEELPLAIAAWLHLMLGHFALAPLLAEVLDRDPLAPDTLTLQTRVLRKLARLLARGRGAPDPSPRAPKEARP